MLAVQSPEAVLHPTLELPQSTSVAAMTLPTPPKTPSPSATLAAPSPEIVIAHYNESLTWLTPFSTHCTIYSKGQPALSAAPNSPFPRVHPLPNIGRESHTYLTHIVRKYDNLSPYTLFLQGNIHDVNHGTPAHTDMTLAEIMALTTSLADGAVLPIGRVHTFSDWGGIQYLPGWVERRGKTLQRTHLSPGQFWEDVLFHTRHPSRVRFVQGALFGVSRAAIWRKPREFWENVLKYFEGLDEVNPEAGHYMERFWYALFSDDAVVVDDRSVNGDGEQSTNVNGEPD